MARDEGIGILQKALYAIQEKFTKAHPTVPIAVAQILAGNAYEFAAEKLALVADGIFRVQVIVPANLRIYWDIGALFSTAYIKYQVHVLSTAATGGTDVQTTNHNLNYGNNSALTVKKNVNDDGVVDWSLDPARLGGPSATPNLQGGAGGLGTADISFWLLPEGVYLFEMTNLEPSNTSDVILRKFWWEEEIN